MKGGGYKAIDPCDGQWMIIRDVPVLSTVPKGIKGAPEDIREEWMSDAVKFGQDLYSKGKTAYPIHIGHNDDLGLTQPEFAGFFKPTRVGTALVEGKEQPAVFSDWKIKKTVFERFAKGELPYVSPEVRNWSKRRISSLALLSSQPPHFAFPMQTISEVAEDPYAVFSADLPKEVSIAKFADGMERVTFDPSLELKSKEDPEKQEESMASEKPTENLQPGKPNNNPVDQKDAPASAPAPIGNIMNDPVVAARFAAIEDAHAAKFSALQKRLDEREASEKAKSLVDKALESMKGYQIGEKAKAQLAKFAAEGEERLNAFVETLKEITPKDPPRTFAAAEAANVSATDPSVVKFAQQGAEKLEAAAKFAAEYRILKGHPAGRGMQITEEQYVKFQMDSAENPEGNHWGINFGVKN